jgi:hypothetical protein
MGHPVYEYRSASARALWATLLFIAAIIADSIYILALVNQLQVLESAKFGAVVPTAQLERQDSYLRLLSAFDVSLSVSAGIMLLVWIYRANQNARALGAEDMEFTPRWSVGWFFVPIASLLCRIRSSAKSGDPVIQRHLLIGRKVAPHRSSAPGGLSAFLAL